MIVPKVRPNIDLRIKAHVRLVASALYEWSTAAGFEDALKDIIDEGVLKNHVFEKIILEYATPEKKYIAGITFVIDWGNLSIAVEKSAQTIKVINSGSPITKQVMREFTCMIEEFVDEARRASEKVVLHSSFVYIDEITNDPQMRSTWNKKFGLHPARSDEHLSGEKRRIQKFSNDELGNTVCTEFWMSK